MVIVVFGKSYVSLPRDVLDGMTGALMLNILSLRQLKRLLLKNLYLIRLIKLAKMKAITVCPLRDIILDPSCKDLELDSGAIVFPLDDGKLYKEHFNLEFIEQIGLITVEMFLKWPYFVKCYPVDNSESLAKETLRIRSKLNNLLDCLWFIKDNAANIGGIYTHEEDKKLYYKVSDTAGKSNSKGEFHQLESFGINDIDKAVEINAKISEIEQKLSSDVPPLNTGQRVHDSPYHFVDHSKTNRIERALSFLVMARHNSFLPAKISTYVNVLECLFTTDTNEITHKVSERVAFYLGGGQDNKKSNYMLSKEIYGIRSKFSHGQQLKNGKNEYLKIVSSNADELLRKVLNKVILEDSEKFLSSKLDDFLNDLIFT